MSTLHRKATSSSHQRGAAALTVTIVLLFVMTLVAAFANRNQFFEQRASANQYRATQAFEAAEAGVEWAIAMLNDAHPIDEHCQRSASATSSFRERYLAADRSTGMQRPTTWNNAGAVAPLRAQCVRNGGGWDCACPASAAPLAPVMGPGPSPAFVIEFAALPQPRLVRIVATGCSSPGGECAPASGSATDATAHVQSTVGLVAGLLTPPAAPLTVKAAVQAGSASLGVHHTTTEGGGFTVHAGGTVDAANLRLSSAPGAVLGASMIDNDAALSTITPERLFASFFGVDKRLWMQHPALTRLRCDLPCERAVLDAAAIASANRLLWIDGDATLNGPLVLGSAERPVVLVTTGTLHLVGPVVIHGLVHAGALTWNGAAGGQLHGAAISEGGYAGDAAADFVYEPTVLATLQTRSGSFARLPGSWRDF